MTELGIAPLVTNQCHEIYFPRLEQCKCVYQPTHSIQVPRNFTSLLLLTFDQCPNGGNMVQLSHMRRQSLHTDNE